MVRVSRLGGAVGITPAEAAAKRRGEARGRSRGSPDGQAARSRAGCPDGPGPETGSSTLHQPSQSSVRPDVSHCGTSQRASISVASLQQRGQVERHTGDAAVGGGRRPFRRKRRRRSRIAQPSRLVTAFRHSLIEAPAGPCGRGKLSFLLTSCLPWPTAEEVLAFQIIEIFGAGEGIRTLDPNLGKVVLYP